MNRLTSAVLKFALVVLILAVSVSATQGASIDVLVYAGGNAGYNNVYTTVGSAAQTYDPNSDGSNTWNVTFWNPGDPTPTFSNYDVFVIPSWLSSLDTSRLLAAGVDASINAARGNRTFLSGQDPDYHYQFGPGAIDNGPRGFLINAVNWAASGTGLGIVALADGWRGTGSTWFTSAGSFLQAELAGFTSYFQEESVQILAGQETFPVNEGLTTAGLSNWGVSSHMGFALNTPGYEIINGAGGNASYAVTIVTEGQAGGGTTPGDVVPEPSTIALMGLGLCGVLFARRRRR